MLAMARHIVYEGLRTRGIRQTILIQAARSKAERPFDGEIAELVGAAKGALRLVRVLSAPGDAGEGVDYDVAGRMDMAVLTRFLQFNDYDFYLCGPPAFTQALYDGLRDYNIADERIHAEAFGPSSLKRSAGGAAPELAPASTKPVPVMFMDTLKEARWTPDSGTLLELAEARGLEPEFSCREGNCGTCRTRLLKGAVTYLKPPVAARAEDEVLICCAVPAQQEEGDETGIQLAL